MKQMKKSILVLIACMVASMMQAQVKTKKEAYSANKTSLIKENSIYSLIDSMSSALNCRIVIKEAPIKTTLNARPAFWSLMGKKSNRKYIIRINNKPDFAGIQLKEVPSYASVGLWTHELMHVKDYQSRNFWGVMQRGFQYLTITGKQKFEHEIDKMVIDHGFGKQLYAWAYYVLEESNASPEYKNYKQRIYLTPSAISKTLLSESEAKTTPLM